MLTGCPSGSGSSYGNSTGNSFDGTGVKYSSASYDSDYYVGGYESEYRTEQSEKRERMMTYSYHTRIELQEAIDDIDEAFEKIMDEAYQLDGYLDSKNVRYWGGTDVHDGYINFTVEIPAENAEAFVEKLREIGWMTNFSQTIRNMTLYYEEAEFQEDYETMHQIEHDVAYSDFSIDLESVMAYTDLKPGFWSRVKNAFKDGLDDFLYWVEDWLVEIWFTVMQFVLVGVPIALVMGLLVGLGLWVLRKVFFKRHNVSHVSLRLEGFTDENGNQQYGLKAFIPDPPVAKPKKKDKKKAVTEEGVVETGEAKEDPVESSETVDDAESGEGGTEHEEV